MCVQVELRKQDHTHVRTCTGNNITGSAVQFAMHFVHTKLSGVATLQLDNCFPTLETIRFQGVHGLGNVQTCMWI